jgi:signal peptidase II
VIKMSARWAGRLVLMVAVLGTIGCDRVTRHIATTTLAGQPTHSYLADAVRLGYVENAGGFLSLGASLPPGIRTVVFTWATGLMLAALTPVAIWRSCRGWPAVGVALFVAGGASNWIDRLVQGSVVDFLNVGIGSVRTGVFNVADMAIMLGVALLVVGQRQGEAEAPGTATKSDAA